MLSSNMLLLNLILLIDDFFNTGACSQQLSLMRYRMSLELRWLFRQKFAASAQRSLS